MAGSVLSSVRSLLVQNELCVRITSAVLFGVRVLESLGKRFTQRHTDTERTSPSLTHIPNLKFHNRINILYNLAN